mgnify:CR=1 FL=1
MPFRDVGSLTAGNRVLVIVLVLVSCLGVALGMSFHVVSMFDQYAGRVEVVPGDGHLDEGFVADLQQMAEALQAKLRWGAWLIMVCALSVALWGIRTMRTRHTRPLVEMAQALENVAQGDLNQRLPVQGPREMEEFAQGFNQMAERVQTFIQLGGRLASGASFEEIFDYIYDSFHKYLPYDRMGVALIDPATKVIRAERAHSKVPIKLGDGYSLPLDKTSLPDVIKSGRPRIITDLQAYLEQHPHSEATGYVVEEGMRSSITMPLKIEERPLGALFFSSMEPHAYQWQHVQFLQVAASFISPALEKGILIGDIILSATMGFAKLAAFRDTETGEHLQRMRRYAATLAKHMAKDPLYAQTIDEAFIQKIYDFSPLHDIGKVGIPDRILLKPGKLTKEEFDIMKQHTVIGAQALKGAEQEALRLDYPVFERAIEIAAYHHERFDGTGYPKGLAGEAIPLSARISAVADVFDALTSPRPYKPAFSFEESVQMVTAGSGTQFDPAVVESFIACLDQFRSIYEAFQEPTLELDFVSTV